MYGSSSVQIEWPCSWPPSGLAGLGLAVKSVPHGGKNWLALSWLWHASPICFRLFWQLMRAAASRTFCTAGRRRPIRMAIIAMTTSNSISVNADRSRRRRPIREPSTEIGNGPGHIPLAPGPTDSFDVERVEVVLARLDGHLELGGVGVGVAAPELVRPALLLLPAAAHP